MGNKKNPPGILDWVFDFFVKPIKNAIGGILRDAIVAVNKADVELALENAKTYASALPFGLAHSPLGNPNGSPAEVVENLEDWARKRQGEYEWVCWELNAIELISLGQVDVAPGYFLGMPQVRAVTELTTDIYQREWRNGLLPQYDRFYLKKYTPLLPEPYRLALAMAKHILPEQVYFDAMAESGFDPYWARVWSEENRTIPDIATLREGHWRGYVSKEAFKGELMISGYSPESADVIIGLSALIPPADDLVTMVVREAFLPEMVVEAPGVFAQHMGMKGYSKEWADRYWTAHFLPIPLTQAYDNLRRGYWTKDQFMFALHIADVHPRWREDIYNVAFNPPSIREMGYGFDVGAFTEDDIYKYRRWGGLSEVDAKKAAQAMVAYRTEAEREAVRREHMRLFALGRIDESSFLQHLKRLGTAPPAIPLWIERGKLEAERRLKEPSLPEQRVVSSSEALWAFKNGLKDEAWTRKALGDLGWTEERISLAIQRVKFELEEAKAEPVVEELRKPAISIIRDYYKYGYITDEQIPLFLRDLGYRDEDAVTMGAIIAEEVAEELKPKRLTESDAEALYDMRLLGVSDNDALVKMRVIIGLEGIDGPTLALFNYYGGLKYSEGDAARLTLQTGIRFAFPDLRAMYSKGWITADILVSELVRLGLPRNRATELAMTVVKMEQPARTVTERDLTKAEIVKGVKNEVFTPAQGVELLKGIGYDENEAWYILAINKVVAVGDPQGYWEMRRVTELAKKARGLPSIDIPEEVIRLELAIRTTKQQIETLKANKATEEQIGEAAVRLAGLESELRQLIVSKKLQ